MNDDKLMLQAKLGRDEAFKMLMEKYKTPIYSYALNMLGDEAKAGDVFQEVFIKIFENLKNYRPEGKFKSWIFKMASNRVMDYFRQKKETDFDENKQASSDHAPADILIKKEKSENLKKALDKLSATDREIIYLKEYGQMTFREISQIMDMPLGTVLAKANRSIKKLRNFLGAENA